MKKIILLIANGAVNERIIDKIKKYSFEKIVAADGGAVKASRFGYVPHIVIGDLDSLPPDFTDQNKNVHIIEKPSQELNDLEKALIYCAENGADHVVGVGITGERLDHTLNNFSVLAKFQQKFEITIFNEHSTIRMVNSEYSFFAKIGQTISLIPMGKVGGITTAGLKFPLNNELLATGVREGAGNEAIDEKVKISVQQGTLLLFMNDVE